MTDTVARPQVELTAVDSTKAAFDAVKRNLESLKTSIPGATAAFGALSAAASVAGLAFAVKGVTEYGEALSKSSEKTGIAVESFAALQYGAKLADVSAESLAKGMKGLAGNVYENDKAFQALGIATRDSGGNIRAMDAITGDVAQAFSQMEDGAGKSALAVRLFGKAGADLIPFLNLGREGLKDAAAEARAFGLVIGGDAAKGMETFNDNLKRMESASQGVKIALVNDLLPSFNAILQAMVDARKAGDGFFKSVFEGAKAAAQQIAGWTNAGELEKVTARYGELTTKLQGLEDVQARGGRGVQGRIDATKAELEELSKKQATLQQIVALEQPGALTSLPKKGTKAAPSLPDDKAGPKDNRFEQAILALEKEKIKTDDLTRAQEILKEIQLGHYGALDEAQKTRLEQLALEVDAIRQSAQTTKELAEIQKKTEAEDQARAEKKGAELTALRAKYIDLIDPLNKFALELAEVDRLEKAMLLTTEDAALARFKVNKAMVEADEKMRGVSKSTQEAGSSARDFGLAMTSALGEVIRKGGDVRDTMKALGADIAQIITKVTLLKPLENSLTNLLGGGGTKGSGGGGGLSDIFSAFMGNILPSFDGGTSYVPRDMIAQIHKGERVLTADENRRFNAGGSDGATYYIDARGADSDGMARLEATVRNLGGRVQAMPMEIMDRMRRGGNYSFGARGT